MYPLCHSAHVLRSLYKSLLVLGCCLLMSLLVSHAHTTSACGGGDDEFGEVLGRLEEGESALSQEARDELALLNPQITDIQDDNYGFIDNVRVLSANGGSAISMRYSARKWVVQFVQRKATQTFHANDMVRDQLLYLRKNYKFPTKLPKNIVRDDITNDTTIKTLRGISSTKEPKKFLRIFLKKTPNGKMTQRMLDDLDMKAIKATVTKPQTNVFFPSYDGELADTGFLETHDSVTIDVEPLNKVDLVIRDLESKMKRAVKGVD